MRGEGESVNCVDEETFELERVSMRHGPVHVSREVENVSEGEVLNSQRVEEHETNVVVSAESGEVRQHV